MYTHSERKGIMRNRKWLEVLFVGLMFSLVACASAGGGANTGYLEVNLRNTNNVNVGVAVSGDVTLSADGKTFSLSLNVDRVDQPPGDPPVTTPPLYSCSWTQPPAQTTPALNNTIFVNETVTCSNGAYSGSTSATIGVENYGGGDVEVIQITQPV
jgi:hypothetical protein